MLMDVKALVVQLLLCDSPGSAKPLVDKLVARLSQITQLELHPAFFFDEAATITSRGKAVSPTTAAQCAEDVERTRVFLQGIYQAITDKQAQKNGRPVNLLYAGTGPFGLLVVPLLPLFDAADVQVTLLDIHQESLDKLQKLLVCLQLQDYVREIHRADACEWTTHQQFDLIISETMKQGLMQEPQVSVFAHLRSFLASDGCLIPEQIRLDLWLSRSGALDAVPAVHLGEIFTLDKQMAAQLGQMDFSGLSGRLAIPNYSSALTDLQLNTFIRVYREHQLDKNQSQLTLPIYEKDARPEPLSELSFHYQMGSYPRCVFTYSSMPLPGELPIPESLHIGDLGIFHLRRLWHKVQLQKGGVPSQLLATITRDEWLLDRHLLNQLGIGLEPAMQQLFCSRTFAEFESWVMDVNGGQISGTMMAAVNQAVLDFLQASNPVRAFARPYKVLTAEQWGFWQEYGYVVIPGVLSASECQAACAAIWKFLGMREDDRNTWYNPASPMQKIMVQLFRDPALEIARNKNSIRQIFADLWQRDDLVMATDRVSFNPPETQAWRFPGPGLHWDVELKSPIAFATQGLIYLSDTSESQGAFSCVPGFHKRIDQWLEGLSQDENPGDQDWSNWPVKSIAANAGDLIIWHQALPHGSSPNRAQLPRIVQYINMYG